MMLVVVRSTLEYIVAFIALQILGPSMLPAILALALHNGAIIGHLIGNQGHALDLRPDAPRGVNLYAWEIVPRLYGSFMALLFYRWEIILRESAILGVLGVGTIGFYIDSAIAELRLDRAILLIVAVALLNTGVDALSRWLRSTLQIKSRIRTC